MSVLVVIPGLQSTDWQPHEITRGAKQDNECCERDQLFRAHIDTRFFDFGYMPAGCLHENTTELGRRSS
jgi:hypothetical protein